MGAERLGLGILLSGELVLLESRHELGRQTERPQAQAALRTAAHVVNQESGLLVHLLLVEELVLDHVHVDKVAHVGARIPTHVVRVNVDLPQHADHLSLVGGVGLRARGGGGRVGGDVVKVRILGHLDDGEGKRVGDLQDTVVIHTNERAGRGSGEGLGAMLDDFHHHLIAKP